jgi:ACR3 family arsenite transporter
MEFGEGSHIVPMMMKVDLSSLRKVGQRHRGLLITLFVNWAVKPFSMAFFA